MKKVLVLTVCILSFLLSGCRQCPFFNKNEDKKNFKIIDTRIGTGDKTVETYINKFKKTDKIKIAYDLTNMTAMKQDMESYFQIRQDLSIKNKEGDVFLLKPEMVVMKDKIRAKPFRFVNDIDLSVMDLKPGTYYVVIFVTDMAAFKTSEQKIEFEVLSEK